MVRGAETGVGEERRARILAAATTVFAGKGFQQARMDDIAAEAALSKPALYLYFPSKDAIVLELMRRLFDRELADLEELARSPGNVRERLLAFNERVLRQWTSMAVHAPLMWEFYAVAMRDKAVRTLVRGYFRTIREHLAALVAQGVEARELTAVDPEEVAIAILALWEGLGVLWATDPRAVKWKEQADASTRLLLAGLERRPSDAECGSDLMQRRSASRGRGPEGRAG
jgi:AcrR family transcriptional regulator